MAYFIMTQVKNKLGNTFLLSGDLLWTAQWKAAMEQANADGKGAANKFGALPIYHDLFNIDSVIGKKLLMISPDSYALVTKTRYPDTPQPVMPGVNQARFTVGSPSLPGVRYDLIYAPVCSSDDIKHNFKLIARYDMFLNPIGCNLQRSGFLGFKCV
jgi:hypothetical protein